MRGRWSFHVQGIRRSLSASDMSNDVGNSQRPTLHGRRQREDVQQRQEEKEVSERVGLLTNHEEDPLQREHPRARQEQR
jgi:hypothetical protein